MFGSLTQNQSIQRYPTPMILAFLRSDCKLLAPIASGSRSGWWKSDLKPDLDNPPQSRLSHDSLSLIRQFPLSLSHSHESSQLSHLYHGRFPFLLGLKFSHRRCCIIVAKLD